MKIAAVICNILLFAFTCMVIATDGPATETVYIIFTMWILLTLILNVVVFYRSAMSRGWSGLFNKSTATAETGRGADRSSVDRNLKTAAIICNIVFIAFVCWAYVDQYPHPEEEGFIEYMVMMVLTPILSLVVLFRSGVNESKAKLRMEKTA